MFYFKLVITDIFRKAFIVSFTFFSYHYILIYSVNDFFSSNNCSDTFDILNCVTVKKTHAYDVLSTDKPIVNAACLFTSA